ncbi:MAG: TldD protein [Candidatus Hydrogenedentota bacterium]
MLDLERHAEEILSCALRNGGDMAEIYVEDRAMASLKLEEQKLEKVVSGTEAGAGIRLIAGDRTLYAHTNDISLKGLAKLAHTLANGYSGPKSKCDFDYKIERFASPVKTRPASISTAEKASLIRDADRVARECDPRVRQVSVVYGDSLRKVWIANSLGRYVEDERPQVIFMVEVVASENGTIQTGMEYIGGTMGYEIFEHHDPIEVARMAARQAMLMLDADPAPAGRMPVVFSSEAGGTMIHEAVGHGLEADHIDKNMSKYCGRLNEQIAVPEVTVVDDGTLPGKRGSCNVDDEGTPMQRTVLVENGRLVRFMSDLRTSRKMGIAPTGNGRRQSYEYKPIPRMTNTFIAPGNSDPRDILSGTNNGLFVKRMGGGQVNTLNGDYVFEVTEGYIIRNGEPMTPVRGATLIGNGPDTLLAIEGVGTDLGYGIGTCGKDGQGVPVSDAQPTIRVRELTVGGTA